MYTLKARIDFTDKYDETKKYKTNEEIVVDEERALELLSSETPVVRYISRNDESTEKDKLINEIEILKSENSNLNDDKTLLETTVETLTAEIEALNNQIKELKSKKKTEDKDSKTE